MILVINPGSTSTKVALYEGENVMAQESLNHSAQELATFSRIADQLDMRVQTVNDFLERHGTSAAQLSAVMARGGVLHPLASGIYRVNERMLQDCAEARIAEHASNLGALIADRVVQGTSVPCYIADPVSVDEFEDVARISGLKELPRRSLVHALNIRRVAYNVARGRGAALEDLNMIVAHLGGGISIAPLRHGRIVDVNNANEQGPFSPERAGGVPAVGLVKLSFEEGADEASIVRRLTREGGLVSYLGTNSAREVEARIQAGDKSALLVYEGMAYQISKEIGAMATVLQGDVDVIVLTGGLANSGMLVQWIVERVGFIAPVEVVPGENELEALNEAYLRLTQGVEAEKTYE
ncbi:MAG: butyrate kinase [Candidatus Cryosericum sp.]